MKSQTSYLLALFVANTCTTLPLVTAFGGVGMAASSATKRPRQSSAAELFSANNDDDLQEQASSTRRSRKEREQEGGHKRFATGKDLKNLRSDIESLRNNLQWAEALKDETRIQSLEKAIEKGEKRDPDFMYAKARKLIAHTKQMKDATQEEKDALIEKWTDVASSARDYLPQFSLGGLWVGHYGAHGQQLINVTYVDDTLHATKVIGDMNVPRGESSFTVDLSPCNKSSLPPIQLNNNERKGEFERFPGRGQVSRKGFKDNRYVEGQMIMFQEEFCFVWIPTKHNVVFSRPSPEMTLRLLRDTLSQEDELENMRNHLNRCYDMDLSTCIARQQDPTNFEPLRRITTQEELDEMEQRFKKQTERNIFFQINKWRKYIDQTLDSRD